MFILFRLFRIIFVICFLGLPCVVRADTQLITLNYNDIPLRQALQFIAQASHQNIIISDAVKGDITLHLTQISPRDALNVILQEAGLGEQVRGNTILISPLQTLAQQEKIQEELQNLAPLQSALVSLHYAKAQEIAHSVKNNNLLSARGSISIDTRTNTVWIQDTPLTLMAVKNFIQQVDIPVKQVLIEARIVSVNKNNEQELGIRFGLAPSTNRLTGKFNVDLPAANPHASTMGIVLSTLKNSALLNIELSALENEGRANIISSPQLMTANQQPATILAGQEIPYQQSTSSGATSVSFKKAAVSLTVTPQITPGGKLILLLNVNQDRPTATLIQGEPVIETRQIQTMVTVKNGQTVVLGGIYEKNSENQLEQVPFLSKLPLLGPLFRHTVTKSGQRELLIFITPRITGA